MEFTFEVLKNTRGILSKIIENTSVEELNKVPAGFNNNIIWNIGHLVVTEQLLAYKLSGLEIKISETLVSKYRKDSKPDGDVSEEEIAEIQGLLLKSLAGTENDYNNGVFKNYNTYTVSTTGNTLNNIDEALQFILVHEGIHYGYILALLKAVKN
ncbi:DinB family protein [Algibacter mikhailovii]|uniref:DinB family protein n=1 Tax=Algibacter mikhailovii TaxID=425498 RepID=UPI0024957C61|nr:DinB family protein [Algibacter mikhailovii]